MMDTASDTIIEMLDSTVDKPEDLYTEYCLGQAGGSHCHVPGMEDSEEDCC